MTLTTAAAGADSSGQGATQVRFVTRSGTNQYQTSLYELLPAQVAQHEHVLQPAGRPPEAARHRQQLRRPHRRPDRDSRPRATAAARRSSSSTMKRPCQPNEARRTRTVHQRGARSRGIFTLQHEQPDVGERARARGRRTASSRRRTRSMQALLAQIRTAVGDGTGTLTTTSHDAQPRDVRLPQPARGRPALADGPRGRQPDDPAPAVGLVLLAAFQRHAGHAEQRRSDVPGLPGLRRIRRRSGRPGRWRSARRSRRTSSTKCSAAGSGRRWTSSATSRRTMFENQGGYALGPGVRPHQRARRATRNGPQCGTPTTGTSTTT